MILNDIRTHRLRWVFTRNAVQCPWSVQWDSNNSLTLSLCPVQLSQPPCRVTRLGVTYSLANQNCNDSSAYYSESYESDKVRRIYLALLHQGTWTHSRKGLIYTIVGWERGRNIWKGKQKFKGRGKKGQDSLSRDSFPFKLIAVQNSTRFKNNHRCLCVAAR